MRSKRKLFNSTLLFIYILSSTILFFFSIYLHTWHGKLVFCRFVFHLLIFYLYQWYSRCRFSMTFIESYIFGHTQKLNKSSTFFSYFCNSFHWIPLELYILCRLLNCVQWIDFCLFFILWAMLYSLLLLFNRNGNFAHKKYI